MTKFASLGADLRKMRKALGLTQSGLAETLGISTPTISMAETGARLPRLVTVYSWAEACGYRPRIAFDRVKPASALDLVNVGHRVYQWRIKNFGEPTPMRNALQICEEAGEVARAVGKADEGIRPETRGDLADELGDVILAVAAFANQEEIDIYAAILRRLARMERLDFTEDPEGGELVVPPPDRATKNTPIP